MCVCCEYTGVSSTASHWACANTSPHSIIYFNPRFSSQWVSFSTSELMRCVWWKVVVETTIKGSTNGKVSFPLDVFTATGFETSGIMSDDDTDGDSLPSYLPYTYRADQGLPHFYSDWHSPGSIFRIFRLFLSKTNKQNTETEVYRPWNIIQLIAHTLTASAGHVVTLYGISHHNENN